MSDIFVHPTAIVEDGAIIEPGSRIWHHAHVRSGAHIHAGCNIGKNVYVDSGVSIGAGSKIQNNVSVYHGVTLGRNVFVGPSAVFTNDPYPRAEFWDEGRLARTVVDDGASVGANATIVCGHTVGRYSMIGAGSVVTRDVPPAVLVIGNPARIRGVVCECGRPLQTFADISRVAAGPVQCACGRSWTIGTGPTLTPLLETP